MKKFHKNIDDIHLNDIVFGFYNKIIIFDHVKNELYCIGTSINAEAGEYLLNAAENNLDTIKKNY